MSCGFESVRILGLAATRKGEPVAILPMPRQVVVLTNEEGEWGDELACARSRSPAWRSYQMSANQAVAARASGFSDRRGTETDDRGFRASVDRRRRRDLLSGARAGRRRCSPAACRARMVGHRRSRLASG